MREKNKARKSLLLFLSFALMTGWVTGLHPIKSSAASGPSLTPMNQPVETLIGGTEAIFRDYDGIKVDFADDQDSDGIDLPFSFTYFGTTYNKIYVSPNGSIKFDSPNYTNIAPFDDDLYVTTKSKVLYTTIGEVHNRKFVIQYTNMMTYGQRFSSTPLGTFQVILNESDHSIQFQYPNLIGLTHAEEAFGSDAWIGIKGPSASVEYADYEKSLAEKQAIRFTPNGSDDYTMATNLEGTAFAAYDANVVYEPIILITDLFPGTAAPVSPTDGSYAISKETFQWSAGDGATSYSLLIATDPEFINGSVVQHGIQQPSYEVTGLREGQQYYWKIICENDTGYTLSNTYTFATVIDDSDEPLNQPQEVLEQGTELALNQSGDFDAIPIGFGPDSKFNFYGEEIVEVYVSEYGDELYLGDNGYMVSNFPELGSFGKVVYKTVGTAPYRKLVIQFTNMSINNTIVGTYQVILYETTNVVQFQYPQLIALDNGAYAFGAGTWIGIEGNTGFVTYSSGEKSLKEKQAIRFIPDGSGNYELIRNAQYEPILLIPDGFPNKPTLVSPADGAVATSDVALQWDAVSNAAGYMVLLSTDLEFSSDSLIELDDEMITDTTYPLSGLEEGRVYYWKVIAFTESDKFTMSNTSKFKVYGAQPAITVHTDEVKSIASMTATAGGSVTLSGNATIAERGIVYASTAIPTIKDRKVKAGTSGTGEYSIDLAGLQANTTYYVRAYAISEGKVVYGPEVTFITLGSDASISGLTLSGMTLDQTVSGSVYSYTANVPYSLSSTTVTATVVDSVYGSYSVSAYNGANLIVGPLQLTSGETSAPIALQVGSTRIELIAYDKNGNGKTYNVTVTRANAPATPSGGGGGGSSTITSKNGKIVIPAGRAGEVSLDGDIEIVIPANASDKQLELTIEKLSSAQGLLGNKEILASAVYEVLKNFPANFSRPVMLTLKFDAAKVKSGQTVAIFYFDETKKVWVKVEGGKIKGDRINAEVNHFTKFAVLVVDEKTGLPVAEPSTPETTEETEPVKLSDISGHWAEASIKDAVKQGIVKGYSDGTFKPNATVTRAEFAVMLMNALKPAGKGAELGFADNAKIGGWAREAIAQAVQANIIKGFSDGTFRPNSNLTRAEMASIVANALKLSGSVEATNGFSDAAKLPNWAKGAIGALTEAGIMQGKNGNKFDSSATATRAEAVTVLLKMLVQTGK
ncbi:S-layer homology domain-containing protein [Cohnella sp.]|uniref:S-layer homology domain-containing protein n=1 Tax=Cohnella sp. TaxID=1883426 RepID=UPI003703FB8A